MRRPPRFWTEPLGFSPVADDGTFTIDHVLPRTHGVSIHTSGGHWITSAPISVRPGEVTDLGNVELEGADES